MRTPTSSAALEARGITVRFGGNVALQDVTIDAQPGQVTGLIGPNGAGKTTLFNVITGLQAPTSGQVLLAGEDISALDTFKRARRGIGRTFQRLELFTGLSVRDNLRVAGDIRNSWGLAGAGRRRINARKEADRILDLTGLRGVADKEVTSIPTGTARIVELGRALMTSPRLLLLDEPASGQTEAETRAFGQLLRRLCAEDGITIVLVEHDKSLVMGVTDRIHVLDFGLVIASGPPEVIRNDPRVLEAYLGTKEAG
jgi:branched-chain amino acid transport system ATP-binding protein